MVNISSRPSRTLAAYDAHGPPTKDQGVQRLAA